MTTKLWSNEADKFFGLINYAIPKAFKRILGVYNLDIKLHIINVVRKFGGEY